MRVEYLRPAVWRLLVMGDTKIAGGGTFCCASPCLPMCSEAKPTCFQATPEFLYLTRFSLGSHIEQMHGAGAAQGQRLAVRAESQAADKAMWSEKSGQVNP